jgi:protein gp37
MGKKTAIAWTDHTFNPWWGCTKIGPGCDNCYAAVWADRFPESRGLWGTGKFRTFSDKHWRQPENWNAAAEKSGVRRRVFCASMADVFDNQADPVLRARLFNLIRITPHLDWQLVTKRIGNVAKMLPADWGNGWPNVWLVPTIVNQEEADRDMPKLFEIPAAVYGVSYEPALGLVDWKPWLGWGSGFPPHIDRQGHGHPRKLNWIIGGGESDQNGMRECRIEWLEDTAEQCRAHGVAYFNKQIGAMPTYKGRPYPLPPRSKGDDPAEWPESIRIREFPRGASA